MSKKILYIANVDWFFVSHRINLAEEALNRGYEVHIAAEFINHYEILKKKKFKLHKLPFKRSKSLLSFHNEIISFLKIFYLLLTIKPNIVHLISLKPSLYGGLASFIFNKVKIIISITGTGFVFNSSKKLGSLIQKILIYCFKSIFKKKSVKVIFQNFENINYFKSHGVLFGNEPSLIKGSGIDLDKFTFTKESKNSFNVMMISRLLKDKGVYEFIEAAKILKSLDSKINMILVGDMDENPMSISKSELDDWIKKDVIDWWGFREDIPFVMSHSNLICLPSYHEGFPKVLMEAAASARAVITTNVPGCRDALIPNKTGLLVEKGSITELVDAIKFLRENENLRLQMGKNGRELAKNNFDINLVTKKHFEIYQ